MVIMIAQSALLIAWGLICLLAPRKLREFNDKMSFSSQHFWSARRLPDQTWFAFTKAVGVGALIMGSIWLVIALTR
jgi:hypothetical protein